MLVKGATGNYLSILGLKLIHVRKGAPEVRGPRLVPGVGFKRSPDSNSVTGKKTVQCVWYFYLSIGNIVSENGRFFNAHPFWSEVTLSNKLSRGSISLHAKSPKTSQWWNYQPHWLTVERRDQNIVSIFPSVLLNLLRIRCFNLT